MDGKFNKSTQGSDGLTDVIAESNASAETNDYSEYYDHISVFYRILSFLFIIVFLVYIVVSSFRNAKEFNYENFEYIVRNFALTLEENKDSSSYVIEYNPDSNRKCATFGNGLAVCGGSWISIYSATGRLTCSESFRYQDPQISASNKFVLVYNSSDYEYSLYNAFGRVYSDKNEEVIRGGAVSDSGYYALITSSEQYNTAVELYDDTFSLIYRFNKNGYVIDVDINDDYLMITTVSDVNDNSYEAEIQIFDIKAQKVLFSEILSDNFPLECGILATGFAVAGNNYASMYDFNGNEKGSFDYRGRSVIDLSLDDEGAVILLKDDAPDAEYVSVVLDDSCSLIYEYSLSGKIYDVEVCGEWSYYLTDSALLYTNGDGLNEIAVSDITEGDEILSFDDGCVYICTATKAPLFDLSSD